MEYVQEIILDLNTNVAYTTIGAKQSDNGTRVVRVYLTRNGEEYNVIDEGVQSAYYRLHKPDGKAVINSVELNPAGGNGRFIELVFSAQALSVPGRAYCDIVLQRGAQILSTVSFILIIMAAPAVAEQGISGNEFGFLTAVVNDATTTVQDSEAWAKGTRGGVPVISQQELSITEDSAVIQSAAITDQIQFFENAGHVYGVTRAFQFTYLTTDNWKLIVTTTNGTNISTSDPEIVAQIESYGVTLTLSAGADKPNVGNTVTITVAEPDPAYQNNAQYFSICANDALNRAEELLSSVVRFDQAQDLTETQKETARSNISAQEAGDYIADPSNKTDGQYLVYNTSASAWVASTLPDFIANPSQKSDGQYLVYDASSSEWTAAALPTYVLDPTSKQDGQYLTYNGTAAQWSASTLPDFIVNPSGRVNQNFLRYNGSTWVGASVSALDLQGIPSILTSQFYGTALPTTGLVQGRIFFMKSS